MSNVDIFRIERIISNFACYVPLCVFAVGLKSSTALVAARSQARECDKRKPEPKKNTQLYDRNTNGSDSKAQK